MGVVIDMTGRKIGRLTVIKRVEPPENVKDKNKAYWLCKCDCCNECVVMGKLLRCKKRTLSCGCIRIEKITKHGLHGTRFYNIWQDMKSRCLYDNFSGYEYYGEKGISVCERWSKFGNFMEDMYESYVEHYEKFGEKDTTLDRINVYGNYEPSNCRWATIHQQSRNTKRVKLFKAISPNGDIYIAKCIKDFAYEHNLNRSNISHCLNGDYETYKGWKFERIE